ncbi:hypothetical protein [Pseudophaeobacter arcticus]|uniref:hypothetical protein n=1 Tax=Pseudophaeobacter arcticus TaxID=385492 RepID=UPI003A96DC4E
MLIQGAMSQELLSSLNRKSTKMNGEQAEKLAAFLSSFEPNKLLDANARTMIIQIKEQGQGNGKNLDSALADSGRDVNDLGARTGSNGPVAPERPLPPQERQGIATVDDDIVELIAATVEDYDATSEDALSLGETVLAALEEAGYDNSQPAIDFYA